MDEALHKATCIASQCSCGYCVEPWVPRTYFRIVGSNSKVYYSLGDTTSNNISCLIKGKI